jgi:predicted  nucleic acid-binding Zn-ribbon protein
MDKLKRYENERSKLNSRLDNLDSDIQGLQVDRSQVKNRLKIINSKIQEIRLKNRGTQITDHARVRYIERVLGIDIKEVDEWIMQEEKHRNVKKGSIITTIELIES